jgi:hypothetical protein
LAARRKCGTSQGASVACRLLTLVAMKFPSALALVFLLAACGDSGDDDPGGPDGGGEIPEPGTPILDRESRDTHACEVLDAPAEVAGSMLGAALAEVDGNPLVARASYGSLGGDEYGHILGVTPASFSPMGLGDETYRKTQLTSMRLPALVASGGGAGLAWAEGDYQDMSIVLGRLDAAGEVVGTPALVAEGLGTVVTVALTADHLLWDEDALHVQPLDEAGAPRGDAVVLSDAKSSGAAIAPIEGGAAVVWAQFEEDIGVYLALIDADGAVTAGPLRVSGEPPELTWLDAPAVIAAGDELLVAWSERFWDEDPDGNPDTWDPRGHAVIRVARVSGDAREVLAFERLQEEELDIVNIQPSFVAQDGAVALSWSRGTFIYVCGGCISDNTRHLVMLEPGDLVPLADPIEMEGPSGFSSAAMTAIGGDLAHVLGLDYHAISTLALARTSCAAR